MTTNKGKVLTTQPIRSGEDIRNIINHLAPGRNRLLFILGMHSALRISDLVKIKCEDVEGNFIILREQKTGKIKPFELNAEVAKMVHEYIDSHPCAWLFQSRQQGNHISTSQARKIITDAAKACGLKHISTHSMRKTFGYHIWKNNAALLPVIMKVFNHSDPKVTMRYIGVDQDEVCDVTGNANFLHLN